MASQFPVKVGEFEGPFGVLLNLVEERKLHISQVTLAQVTDDFISHLKTLDADHKPQMADFILVAATLMLIKSVSLLPQLSVTTEEKQDIEELERRLKLYQMYQEIGVLVKEQFGRQVIFGRQPSKEIVPVFTPTHEVTLDNLLNALKQVINNLPKAEILPQAIVKKVISLEEVIADLTTRVQRALKMSFKDFVKDQKDRVNIVVSFLGMLELVKQGIVNVEQSSHFSDISIETTEPSTPRYN